MSNQGRVFNSDREVVATGACEVNEERLEVTLRPFSDTGLLDKQTGPLILELDDGRTLELASKYMRFRMYGPDGERQSIYRLRYLVRQEAQGLSASR